MVTLACQVPTNLAGTFSEDLRELLRDPTFNDLSVRIVKKPSQRNFAPVDLLTYAASITIVASQGPDAARRLEAALKLIKKFLDSKKIEYKVKKD